MKAGIENAFTVIFIVNAHLVLAYSRGHTYLNLKDTTLIRKYLEAVKFHFIWGTLSTPA